MGRACGSGSPHACPGWTAAGHRPTQDEGPLLCVNDIVDRDSDGEDRRATSERILIRVCLMKPCPRALSASPAGMRRGYALQSKVPIPAPADLGVAAPALGSRNVQKHQAGAAGPKRDVPRPREGSEGNVTETRGGQGPPRQLNLASGAPHALADAQLVAGRSQSRSGSQHAHETRVHDDFQGRGCNFSNSLTSFWRQQAGGF